MWWLVFLQLNGMQHNVLTKNIFNPLKSDGLFHAYILEESICYIRGIRCNFLGLFGSWEKLLFANSGDPDQTPQVKQRTKYLWGCLQNYPIVLIREWKNNTWNIIVDSYLIERVSRSLILSMFEKQTCPQLPERWKWFWAELFKILILNRWYVTDITYSK